MAPFSNEQLVGEALTPFRGHVVMATKFGFKFEDFWGESCVIRLTGSDHRLGFTPRVI